MILFGCDHAGFQLKEVLLAHLASKNIATQDFGCYTEESIDYPDFAHPVAIAVSKNPEALGVLICGSGNGINMTANKHSGIRSALCWKISIVRGHHKLHEASQNRPIHHIPADTVDALANAILVLQTSQQ